MCTHAGVGCRLWRGASSGQGCMLGNVRACVHSGVNLCAWPRAFLRKTQDGSGKGNPAVQPCLARDFKPQPSHPSCGCGGRLPRIWGRTQWDDGHECILEIKMGWFPVRMESIVLTQAWSHMGGHGWLTQLCGRKHWPFLERAGL